MGIPRRVLKQFEKEDDPLSAAMDYWLEGNIKNPAMPISWQSLVAVLNAESIEETALANRISKNIVNMRPPKFKKVGIQLAFE